MMREKTVFGPIFSRRLGSSLGINLLPQQGKVCNFDCIYCECGWNKDGLEDRTLPSARDVRKALEAKLSACKAAGTPIDSITFSGDGEPTLNPEFPEIIDLTLELRDRYYPQARVSVLSNATRAGEEAVFRALQKVDNAILKLDAPTDERVALVNRPVGPLPRGGCRAESSPFRREFRPADDVFERSRLGYGRLGGRLDGTGETAKAPCGDGLYHRP